MEGGKATQCGRRDIGVTFRKESMQCTKSLANKCSRTNNVNISR